MSDLEPDAGQGDGRQAVSRQLAAARCDRAEVLEPSEKTLDKVALPTGGGATERRSLRLLRVGMCGREPSAPIGSRMARASCPRSATVSRAGGTPTSGVASEIATGARLHELTRVMDKLCFLLECTEWRLARRFCRF